MSPRRAIAGLERWLQAAIIVFLTGFTILGVLAHQAYTDHAPIPERVVSTDGRTLYTRADILEGQQIFLHGWHGREEQTLSFRRPGTVALTPGQRTTAWFFLIMSALFLVQTLVHGCGGGSTWTDCRNWCGCIAWGAAGARSRGCSG